jgi:LacI family transcriptional regulator
MSSNDALHLVRVDPTSDASIASQLRSQLEWLIARGVVRQGDQLPPIRDFSQRLGVNYHTLRGVYQQLDHDGLVDSQRGRGTTVLDYRNAPRTIGPRSARSFAIGVIIPTHLEFYTPFLNALDSASQDPALLFICVAHRDPQRGLSYIDQLVAKNVDGIIVAGEMVPEDFDPSRVAAPVVFADYPGAPGPSVVFDHQRGSALATAHLLEHGHRRVGFITPPLGTPSAEPKHLGFRETSSAAGLPESDILIEVADDFGVEPGYEAGRRLLSRPDRPTGIATASDSLATGVLRAARELGIAVPHELAIVGNDNIASGQDTAPPLTTVDAPADQLGTQSIRLLEHMIAGDKIPDRSKVLETKLIRRESCGCGRPSTHTSG